MITISSGDAGVLSVVQAYANGLGHLSLLADLRVRMPLRVLDSTASKGMRARQGLGKISHLDVQELWVQQRIRNCDFALELDRRSGGSRRSVHKGQHVAAAYSGIAVTNGLRVSQWKSCDCSRPSTRCVH